MFVYVFYRLAAASLFLTPLAILLESQNKVFWRNAPPMSFRLLAKMFLYALVGNTLSMILYNGSLKYTSATVASAMCNSIPAITFFLALLMRMEVIKFRSSSGMAKTAGIALCLAGVLVVALCAGRPLSPLGRHRVLASHGDRQAAEHVSKGVWIAGTFVMLLSCVGWSLWIVFQGLLLKEYPNKLLATLIQCLFGAMQSGLVAAVAERGHPSRWKLGLDLSLVAVAYSGIVGTGACYYLQTWCVGMEGPVFLAMWNPLSLLLTVLCSSLLGETVHLGSILGGILLVGGLYCVLWGKNKEETLAAMASGHLEQSREQGDADAASCTSTSVIFKNQDEDKEAGGRLEPFNHIT
ncbi:WAT1-related protein At5g64700-like [Panicum hallii]|uniref:WAT1-related protein At5g64700-like n=1 Tax=Panicum hallii TaxID=206008 RepID=UPI000DF4D778|nr:WAT1-related protein At5g64700-like [Panicum hallii]